MAKGASSKQIIIDKIMEIYPAAFIYGKELRIPMEEDGQNIEIKLTLACAKNNVKDNDINENTVSFENNNNNNIEPSDEEKENISKLMERLGL